MSALTQDPMFLYAVSFFIFLALAFRYGRQPLLGWLDGEIAKIRAELDHAYQLRTEAEAALADCKAKQIQAETDAANIVNNARLQVELMRKQAEEDLAALLARHEQLAADRIRLAEAEAVADVRAAAIDLAMTLARKTLAENLPGHESSKLIDKAIGDIPGLKANKKAEAA